MSGSFLGANLRSSVGRSTFVKRGAGSLRSLEIEALSKPTFFTSFKSSLPDAILREVCALLCGVVFRSRAPSLEPLGPFDVMLSFVMVAASGKDLLELWILREICGKGLFAGNDSARVAAALPATNICSFAACAIGFVLVIHGHVPPYQELLGLNI